MSGSSKHYSKTAAKTELANQNNQVNEAKIRLYTLAVNKANRSQRKVVDAASQNFCCV